MLQALLVCIASSFKIKPMKHFSFLLVVGVALGACADQDLQPSPVPAASSEVATYLLPEGVDLAEAHLKTVAAEKATSEIAFRDRADTWAVVHARMMEYIDGLPVADRYYAQQIAPTKVLPTHLLSGEATPAKAAAAAEYLEMMVETKSIDARLALATLEAFEPDLDPSFRTQVARAVSDNVFSRVESQRECENCRQLPADLASPADVSISDDRRIEAAETLRQIAARS